MAQHAPTLLLATLGSEPQVVTLALQALLRRGEVIDAVCVIHTSSPEPRLAAAVDLLKQTFAAGDNGLGWAGRARFRAIESPSGPVADFLEPDDFRAALATVYQVVRDEKLAGRRIHFNLSGGRKVMTLCAMTAAQLLFDQGDHLWYLQSDPALVAGRDLFARDPAQITLVEIPLLRWSPAPPMMTDVALAEDPVEAIRRVRTSRRAALRRFLDQELTPAEREIALLALRTGETDRALAARLGKSPRTVSHQLGVVYAKLRSYLGLRDDVRVDRRTLLREFGEWVADEAI